MKLVFAGTPPFAAAALAALIAAGHEIVLVLTQPDRMSGRGLHEKPSAVKTLAATHSLPIFQPEHLKDATAVAQIAAVRPDLMVVAAYGLILPQNVLDIAPLGALNIHASLLPRWRGAAPIQRAILAGDMQTGVCIMQMDAGLDTGAVLRCQTVEIAADDTAGTLLDKLTVTGARLAVDVIADLERGPVAAHAQPAEGLTYAAKIQKREARIDWQAPAHSVERLVRAFNPVPGAVTRVGGGDVKVWRATACPGSGAPGQVLSVDPEGIRVACADGAVRLLELQRAGGRRQPADEFVRGAVLRVGDFFEAAASV
jgi:methionyl-tRNA formyltransferase